MNDEFQTIFVVEDDEPTQNLLRIWLSRAGYTCQVFCNAGQLLTYLKTAPLPQLILMDIRIPGGINGIELTRFLKCHPTTHAVPIMILTVDAYEKGQAMAAGASNFLIKPISKTTLLAEVQKSLSKQHQ